MSENNISEKNMADKKIDFAKEMARLDEIVEEVSSKTLSLDESLKLYEEGNKIIKELEASLKEAEEKVEKIYPFIFPKTLYLQILKKHFKDSIAMPS